MSYYGRSTTSSILEVFSINPLPGPVLLIFAVIFFFLGLQWYISYEDIVEAAEESMGWALMAAPLVLLLAVQLLSSFDGVPGRGWLYGGSQRDRRQREYLWAGDGGGSSPWGVAALILLLLVLVQYQSDFLESWFI